MKTLKKRRKANKTDYGKRLKLLKSEKPRLVFRKTNKYIIAQYVESDEARDKVVVGMNSKEILKYGWPENAKGSLKSLPASYLTGFLIGNKIKEKEVPIIDFGMNRNLHKSRIYAFVKGVIDAGVGIKVGKKEIFPSEDRIEGKHMKEKIDFQGIKLKIGGGKDE